jgi:hypothetical protein
MLWCDTRANYIQRLPTPGLKLCEGPNEVCSRARADAFQNQNAVRRQHVDCENEKTPRL